MIKRFCKPGHWGRIGGNIGCKTWWEMSVLAIIMTVSGQSFWCMVEPEPYGPWMPPAADLLLIEGWPTQAISDHLHWWLYNLPIWNDKYLFFTLVVSRRLVRLVSSPVRDSSLALSSCVEMQSPLVALPYWCKLRDSELDGLMTKVQTRTFDIFSTDWKTWSSNIT